MAELILFGASGGIGQHLIRELGATHKIIGTYNSADPKQLAEGAAYHQVDAIDARAVSKFAAEVTGGLQQPVLIYTPAISPSCPAHKFSEEDWDRTIATNLTGAMNAVRAFLPTMRSLQWGRVIFLSSVLSRQGVPGTIAYSATKAALCAMARVVSVENAPKGITANALVLGYYSVGIIDAVPEKYLNEHVLPKIPQGRLGDPANITAAVRFIIEADYLSGASIDINGGMFGA